MGGSSSRGSSFPASSFRSPMISSGPRTIVPSGSRPVFTTVPSGAFFHPVVAGRFGNFVAFGHNPRFRVFFNNSCFGCRRFFLRGGFSYPYIYPGYYPYYGQAYDTSYTQPSYPASPTVVVVQSPPPAGYSENDQLIQEVEGLRSEVQQLREEQRGRQTPVSPSGQTKPGVRPSAQASTARVEEAPSTILVFRDGQRTEVRNYAITGKTLWVFNERQARKILLSDLDVSATQAANAAQGIEFSLPR